MNPQHSAPPAETQTTELYYPLTCSEWLDAVRRLRPAERDVLYYLRTVDPFGKGMDIGVRETAALLGHNPSTVSRALKALDQAGFIDLELINVQVRIKPCGKLPPEPVPDEFSTEETCCLQTTLLPTDNTDDLYATPAIATQHLSDHSDLKPAPSGGFKNADVPIVLKRSVKEQKHPPTHPVPNQDKQEEIGTTLEAIAAAGIPLNKTIQKTVAIALQKDPATAAARVRNALSAVKEQQDRGNCRNPGGLFITAMQKGFTANELKGAKRSLPDLKLVEMAIDRALLMGDRAFASLKLQDLWAEGWQSELEELCRLRNDWGFRVTSKGVVEKQQAISHDRPDDSAT